MIHLFNDWFFMLVDRYMDVQYGKRKRELLKDHPDNIVEIGAGYGANFRYLRPGTKLIAIEPNESFNQLLKRRASRYSIEIEIYNEMAESLNLETESAKMVLGTLVLCTVESPKEVLNQIHRILKKDGRYIFIEHVEADQHFWICKVQHFIKEPWKWFFDGCHVTRKTGNIIDSASFTTVQIEEFNNKTVFIPIIPHICGVAVR